MIPSLFPAHFRLAKEERSVHAQELHAHPHILTPGGGLQEGGRESFPWFPLRARDSSRLTCQDELGHGPRQPPARDGKFRAVFGPEERLPGNAASASSPSSSAEGAGLSLLGSRTSLEARPSGLGHVATAAAAERVERKGDAASKRCPGK